MTQNFTTPGTDKVAELDDDGVAAGAAVLKGPEYSKLTDEVDALLNEIDDVLEVNAEEFVKDYVQRGGQ